MVNRFSSLRGKMFTNLLEKRLDRAVSYDRIAGYFSSSILEIAGEAIEKMEGKVRIICNSELEAEDIRTAQLAERSQHQEWCNFKPEDIPDAGSRFEKLFNLLSSGKLEVKVLPKEKFGLAHGKAGVITFEDGTKTSFLGSANETLSAWTRNYELVWEDNSDEAVEWVQKEFDLLWNSNYAIKLSESVIQDIERLSKRTVYPSVKEWKEDNDADIAAAVAVESPVYRSSFGLWPHQKYFVDLAMKQHKTQGGARLINADQVGLGKTIQLATAAMLMSIYDDKPVLAIVPKTLLKQWRDDMNDLLGIPSAYWDGREWVDEADHTYPLAINQCPRRIGIVSQGIIVNGSESCDTLKNKLLNVKYACVIVDEAHRARRKNMSPNENNRRPEKNNLYNFLSALSSKTHSMLLATATPIQMNAIEAWDLLNILSGGSKAVLGTEGSKWTILNERQNGLDIVAGRRNFTNPSDLWEWLRNPLPHPAETNQTDDLRLRLLWNDHMNPGSVRCDLLYEGLPRKVQNWISDGCNDENLIQKHNPYIDHIIRRERQFLENTINPQTGTPYLQKIEMKLFGESGEESIILTTYLKEAYELAEKFCTLLKRRCPAGGLFQTQLLRRIGSSIIAGYKTGKKMLENWTVSEDDDEDDDEHYNMADHERNELKNLTTQEREILSKFVRNLEVACARDGSNDPKLAKVLELLEHGISRNGIQTGPWKDIGCILFSQYLDTADWIAKNLSLHYPNLPIGLYAGGTSSKLYYSGNFTSIEKNELKKKVADKEIKILVGTDAASEGLNLQKLGTLINVDLPWNPTRLEQRKGRIQRIGQVNDVVYIYNMKYKDSVEEKVHEMLSSRLETIHNIFGQIPDTLEDVWIDVAIGEKEEAERRINAVPEDNPFVNRYNTVVEDIDWESCTKVLKMSDVNKELSKGWC